MIVQAGWLDRNSTARPTLPCLLFKLEGVEPTMLKSCFALYFCASQLLKQWHLFLHSFYEIASFTHVSSQNCYVNSKHKKTMQGWADWLTAWPGSTWLNFFWTGFTCLDSQFSLFCLSRHSIVKRLLYVAASAVHLYKAYFWGVVWTLPILNAMKIQRYKAQTTFYLFLAIINFEVF